MKRFLRDAALVVGIVGLFCLIFFWHLVWVHVSQWTGTSNEASRAYAYWSGFGSVWPWNLVILGSIIGLYRVHFECHSPTCHWPVVHTTKNGHKLCKKCVAKPNSELDLHEIHPDHL